MSCITSSNPAIEIAEGTDAFLQIAVIGNNQTVITDLTSIVQSITYKVSTDSTGDTQLILKEYPGEIELPTTEVKLNFRCTETEVVRIPIYKDDISSITPGTYYHECKITDINGFTTTVFRDLSFTVVSSSIDT